MSKKKNITPYLQKIGALLVLSLLFIIVASVRADAPYDVDWQVSWDYSDEYQIQDLTFVWGGETGNATNLEVTGCSTFECIFSTSYDLPGDYSVSVYAKNNQGQTVSNTAICSANIATQCPCTTGYECINNRCIYDMEPPECKAYTSADAQHPTLWFDPTREGYSSEVWWRVDPIQGGQAPYTYSWNGDSADEDVGISDTGNPIGPYYVASVDGQSAGDYDINGTYTMNVGVRDANNILVSSSCTIATKQCAFNEDCVTLGYPTGYYCSTSTYTCVPPDPIFVDPLEINPGVVRSGEQCNLSWTVENAVACDVYKNNTLFQSLSDTATTSYKVLPGTYHIQCLNSVDETVTAGPAQCIYNPEVRES
jgi:hypothetical protein